MKFKAAMIKKDGFSYIRTIEGSLLKDVDLDTSTLRELNLTQLKTLLEKKILPIVNPKLQVYKGDNHIRVFKNPKNSHKENYLFIGDSCLTDS